MPAGGCDSLIPYTSRNDIRKRTFWPFGAKGLALDAQAFPRFLRNTASESDPDALHA